MSSIAYDLTRIRAVAFDVDGVLSPSTIPMSNDGIPQLTRYSTLGIHDIYLKASHKLPVLEQWMKESGLEPHEVAYCGDDIPDIPAMKAVGLAVAPRDAAVEVRDLASYISPFNGGYGVARDLIEQILKAKGQWLADAEAFGW